MQSTIEGRTHMLNYIMHTQLSESTKKIDSHIQAVLPSMVDQSKSNKFLYQQ
jgi:hypothetical protein